MVEVSAHGGARPEHAEWQGKVYSLRGETKGYKTLEDACEYGSVTGLCGVNCRHTFFPYYKGSTKTYTNKELTSLKNETVEYNGKKINKYDASQIQRKLERNIRQNKKDIVGLQGILTSNNKDLDIEKVQTELKQLQLNLKANNGQLNRFLNETGFRKDNTRLYIGNIKLNDNIKDKANNINYNLKGFEDNIQNIITQRINKLQLEYNSKLQSVEKTSALQGKSLELGHVDNYGTKMYLTGAVKNSLTTIEHEFAHTLAENRKDRLLNINEDFWKEIQKVKNKYIKELRNIEYKNLKDEITGKEAMNLKRKINIAGDDDSMNNYALTNLDEFMAVSFEYYKNGLTESKYAEDVVKIINKYFKR